MTSEKRLSMLLDYIKKTSPEYMKYYGNMSPDADSSIVPIFGLLAVAQDIRNEIVGKEVRASGKSKVVVFAKDIYKKSQKSYNENIRGQFTIGEYTYITDAFRAIRVKSGTIPNEIIPECRGIDTIAGFFDRPTCAQKHDLPTLGELTTYKAEHINDERKQWTLPYQIGAAHFNIDYLIIAARSGVNTVYISGAMAPAICETADFTAIILPLRM